MQRACLSALVLAVIMAGTAAAQGASTDSTSSGTPQRLWISAGLGSGNMARVVYPLLAGHAGLTYSYGRWLVTGCAGGTASGLFSDNSVGTSNWALMAGLRTSGDAAFLTQAIGVGGGYRRTHLRACESCSDTSWTGRRITGLAFEAGAHANLKVIGLALNMFGLRGSSDINFIGWSVAVELGSFGH